MSIETIEFNNNTYPALQAKGNAAKWCREFAKDICKGAGADIGYSNPEWKLPLSDGIDLGKWCDESGKEHKEPNLSATSLDCHNLDYIHSSHCLEHLTDWVGVLDYWHTKLKTGGVLFLYLPNCDAQVYWQPANNRKHVNHLNPEILQAYFDSRTDKWGKVTVTKGYDLNYSFYVLAEKI